MEDAIGQAVESLFSSGAPVNPSQKQKFHLFCLPVERCPVLFVLLVRPTPCALHPRGSNNHHHRHTKCGSGNLPNHLVGLVALAQAEGRSQVAGKVLLLLDVGQQRLVDHLLVCCAAGGNLGLLYAILSALVSSTFGQNHCRPDPCPNFPQICSCFLVSGLKCDFVPLASLPA